MDVATLSMIVAAINALSVVFKAAKSIGKFAAKSSVRSTEFEGIRDLSKAVFDGGVSDGNPIEVEGIVSRFSHFYTPRVYLPVLPGEAIFPASKTPREANFKFNSQIPRAVTIAKGMHFHRHNKLNRVDRSLEKIDLSLRLPYLPITALPIFDAAGRKPAFRLSFLYPRHSKGFLALPPLAPQNSYFVPDDVQGIPLLIPRDICASFQNESLGRVEGIVRSGADNLIDLLANSPLDLRRQLAYQFYRPEVPTTKAFYIEVTGIGQPRSTEGVSPSFLGTIAVESHFDRLAFEDIADFFQDYTLENLDLLSSECASGFSPGHIDWQGASTIALKNGNIVASGKNMVGEYCTVDLRQDESFSEAYRYLRDMHDSISRAALFLGNELQAKFSYPTSGTSVKLDFLFDYECQMDFAEDGVLSDPAIVQAIGGDQLKQEVRLWLRQQK